MTARLPRITRATPAAAFKHSESGAIAIIFALSVFVLISCVGAAIDFGRAYAQRQHLQSALDAAALAAARAGSFTDDVTAARRTGEAVFQQNYPDHANITYDFQLSGGSIKATASRKQATSFIAAVGFENLDLAVAASVPLINQGKAEVVLVLDYSDSMTDNGKYIRMREAALRMIDVISDNGRNRHVKFGLVPFSAVVHADIQPAYVRSDVAFEGCTVDRGYPYNTTEGVTTSGDDAKWGAASAGGHGCAAAAARNLKVMPLTDDLPEVRARLSAMQPYQWTHIALGAEFGFQLLSPSGLYGNGREYSEEDNVKVAVILTDGMQTAHAFGPDGSRSAADGEANLRAICSAMKTRKIRVYTIGYDLNDAHTLDLLRDCAGDGMFYNASDLENGLLASLNAIANDVRNIMLRLTR